jgi:hypothetical protein
MQVRLLPALLVSCLAAACAASTGPSEDGERCPVDAPAFSLPEALRGSLQEDRAATIDSELAAVAREVPGGWGGMFYREGRLTLYLVDPSKREEAIAALEQRLPGTGYGHVVPELRNARILQGRWDFAQMYDWYRYLNQHVWSESGITSGDIDEAKNRIEFGARDEAARARLNARLDSLDLPCGLVVVVIRAPAAIQ